MARHKNGWVKIYRAAILGDIGSNFIRGGLFQTLVCIANIQVSTVSWRGQPRTLVRGEIITSLTELANLGEVDRSTVLRHLSYLVARGTLTFEKSNRGILIKLLNYEKYQALNAEGPHQTQQQAHIRANISTNNGPTHNEELKKERRKEGDGPAWALLEVWNENRGSLPQALSLSPTRIKHANQRMSEFPDQGFWVEVIQRMAASPFCTGQNDRGWKADFDFLIKPGTHIAVNEGKYDGRKNQTASTFGVIGA